MSKRKIVKPSVPVKGKSQKKLSPTGTSTPVVPGPLTLSAEAVDRLIAGAQHQQHPYGKVWQRFDLDSFNELAGNVDRRGLDQDILLYQGMILEGWHRFLACLATKVPPKFVEFKGTDLEAAERVHASGIRRHSRADQRYASFLLLCDACPEFKARYAELKTKGEQQQKEGRPLDTDAQRVDVVQAKADSAGVSKTTAKKVEKVKKGNPGAVSAIAAGKTTANKELKKIKKVQTPQRTDKTVSSLKDKSGKAERPKIADLVGIIHRCLGSAEEVEQLSLKTSAVFFVVNGYRVKVTCQLV